MRFATILAALAIAVSLTACSAGATPASGGGASGASSPAAIVAERCTRCHNTDRIKAAKHDKAGWEATVSRMRGKGAQLTDAEAAQVVDFLASGGASQL